MDQVKTEDGELTSENRAKLVDEFVQHLTHDGAPGEVIQVFKSQADTCYVAYCAGKMAAKRMFIEGEITEDKIFEVSMDFAKLMIMKLNIAPQQSPLATGLPEILGIPPGARR